MLNISISNHDSSWMKSVIAELCNLNRTIVSKDNALCLKKISEIIPLKIHKYPTGKDYSTWEIPPQWDVEEAYLSDGDNIIASYEEHPLFLAPYSIDFDGWVTKEQLMENTTTKHDCPDHFFYQHRIAANYKLRLKKWGISLPFNRVKALNKDKYYLKIKTKVSDGHLMIGESFLPGKQNKIFSLLSHLCHSGQANDGLAGIAACVEIMRRLKKRKNRKFNYQMLIMPETFGSAVYLSDNQEKLHDYLGVLFLEMAGAGKTLTFNNSRRSNTYFDKLLHYVVKNEGSSYKQYDFHRGIGNDELNFDWPAIGIPGLAIYWDEFPQYHTSADTPELIDESKLLRIVDVVMSFIDVLELDFVPCYKQKIPIYQSRYDLYVDAFMEKELYQNVTDLLFGIDGKKTLFELVLNLDISFWEAMDYIEKYVSLGFIAKGEVPLERYRDNLV